jgi:hypothetical protein
MLTSTVPIQTAPLELTLKNGAWKRDVFSVGLLSVLIA